MPWPLADRNRGSTCEVRVPFEALLVDLDGTLVDSTAAVEGGWAAWAEGVGADAEAVLAVAHGQPSRVTVEQFLPGADVDFAVKKVEALQVGAAVVQALPGALEFIGGLEPSEWAIVTSGSHHTAEHRLRQAALPRPEHLVTADDYRRGKPSPDPYLLGARLLAVDPSRCVALEDTASGATSAQRAGAVVVGLAGPATTYPAGVVIVGSLADLAVDRSGGTRRLVVQARAEQP